MQVGKLVLMLGLIPICSLLLALCFAFFVPVPSLEKTESKFVLLDRKQDEDIPFSSFNDKRKIFHQFSDSWKKCLEPFDGFPSKSSQIYNQRPIIVHTWHPLENFLFIHQNSIAECPVPCFFSKAFNEEDISCWEEIDNFIFHPPTQSNKPDPFQKLSYQSWTLFFTEAEENYPILFDANYRSKFDINMSFHLEDTVPFTYFIDKEFYFDYWNNTQKTAEAPIVLFMSNCNAKNGRNQYIEEMFKWIKIDSYGACFRNKEMPSFPKEMSWEEQKWRIMAKYKFSIAFENVIQKDYVTEKLFHSFITKTVPIYMGAPNIQDFLPDPYYSIINTNQFLDAKSLSQFIIQLSTNEKEYEKYVQWTKKTGDKREMANKRFERLAKTSPRSAPCRLCLAIKSFQQNILHEIIISSK